MNTQEIYLSIAPDSRRSALRARMSRMARIAAKALDQEIHPVTIISRRLPLDAKAIKKIQKALIPQRKGQLRAPMGDIEILRSHNADTVSRVSALIASAAASKASCIVVGTKATRGTLRGSFTERLVRESPTPVIIVKPRTEISSGITKIAFASDLDADSRLVFRKLCYFASDLGAEIKLIHATPADQTLSMEGKVSAFSKIADTYLVGFSYELIPAVSSRADTVLEASQDWKADLIALGAGSVGTLRGHFFGSTPLRLIRKATRPLWVYHPSKRH
jgi:nucleotide-binding universal stress UspA family protein